MSATTQGTLPIIVTFSPATAQGGVAPYVITYGSTLGLNDRQSGTLFPLGTTTIVVQVTDSQGVTLSATFTVTVTQIPPTLPPPSSGLNAHPRIFLNTATLALVNTKAGASDPDWLALIAAADAHLLQAPPRITITSATNANPAVFTANATLPWSSGAVTMYVMGATGGWSSLNNNPPLGAWTAVWDSATTFHIVGLDSSSFGSFAGQSITVWAYGGLSAGYLDYGQTGDQWFDAGFTLSLAYVVTSTASYRTKAYAFLDWWNELGAAGMVAPTSQDSGRGSFSVQPAVCFIYDWLFSGLSSPQKTASVVTLNLWNDWTNANGQSRHSATSNFWEGHQLAFLMTGYATFNENSRAQFWLDQAQSDWNLDLVPMFSPPVPGVITYGSNPGYYYSGMAVSGFNYGGNDVARHVQRLFLTISATNTDTPNGTDYAKRWAKNLLYQLKPDRWKAPTFGQWTGDYSGVMKYNDAIALSGYLAGTTEGAWIQYYLSISGVNAAGIPAGPQGFVEGSTEYKFRLLFYDSTRTATDYTPTLPPYYYSDGGQGELLWRDGWAITDQYAGFWIQPGFYSASFDKQAGHIDLTRGSDYLLVQSNYFKGTTDGLSGVPANANPACSQASTLDFYDGGAVCFTGGEYEGCQMLYGSYRPPLVKQTANYSYGENEFASMYATAGLPPSARTLPYFFRAFVCMGSGVYVVWDRILSTHASDTKTLRWHLPGTNTPTIASGTASVAIGSSKIWIKPLNVATTMTVVRNTVNGVNMNWRVDVEATTPAVGYNVLTPIQLTASGGSQSTTTALSTIDANHVGVQVETATPKIVVFPVGTTTNPDGTYRTQTYTTATFTTTHSGTGNYLVAGLTSGTYGVSRNGTDLGLVLSVDTNGVAYFSASAGAIAVAPLTGGGGGGGETGGDALTADILLSGSTVYQLVGTPTQRKTLNANGHRFMIDGGGSWTGSLVLSYVDIVGLGTASLFAIGDNAGTSYGYLNGATVVIDNCTFSSGGAFNFFSAGASSITFTNNWYKESNLIAAGGPAAQAVSFFTEQGSSTQTKLFQGNRIEKGSLAVASPNWVIGTASGVEDTTKTNYLIGKRVGIICAGSGSVVRYNYSHVNVEVTPQNPFWSQVGNIGPLGTGVIAENNVFRTAHWVGAGIDGTLRNNVLLESHGHDFVRNGSGGTLDSNICVAIYPGAPTYGDGRFTNVPSAYGIYQSGGSLTITHSTVDGRNCDSRVVSCVSGATVTAYKNSVVYKQTLSGSGCPSSTTCTTAIGASTDEGFVSPPPNRALFLDYNDTYFDPASARKVVYDLGVAGKVLGDSGYGGHDVGTLNAQGSDPLFRGPLPIGTAIDGSGSTDIGGFPFNDADILAGTYTVTDMLNYFRWVFAPGSGSPLLGAGEGGSDIGAVQVSTLPPLAPPIVTTNKRPMVYAGPSFSTTIAAGAFLSGYGADDGLPINVLTFAWSTVSAPSGGIAAFAQPGKANTSCSFNKVGVYVLRLTASDTELTSTSDCTITVTA